MKPTHIEHIGIAVTDLNNAIAFLKRYWDKNAITLKKLLTRK